MVNVKRATAIIGELALMKYFPSDPDARTALVRIICNMASNEEQIRKLVDRSLALYREWPGINELRACFCSFAKPADGVEAYSEVYIDGIPTEKEQSRQIEAPELPALPPGAVVTDKPELDAAVVDLAKKKKMPSARGSFDRTEHKLRQMGL